MYHNIMPSTFLLEYSKAVVLNKTYINIIIIEVSVCASIICLYLMDVDLADVFESVP